MKVVLSSRFMLAVWLCACGLASACVQTTPPTSNAVEFPARARSTGARGGRLVHRVSAPPKSFNYFTTVDEATNLVAFFLTGGRLVEFDHDQQTYVPALAEAWQVAADGRTVEVTMRAGLKFSDGQPLTADDVAFTLRALYDPRTASPLYGEAMLIGGQPITVQVTDARHLRLVFPEQIAAPENYLSNLAVLPRRVLEADFNKGTLKDAYGIAADPQQIVTAGAFMVAASAPGERVTLKPNPYYWKKDAAGTQLPYLDELVLEVAPDANAAITRLQQGTLDIFDRVRPTDYVALRNAAPVRALDLGPSLYADDFWFNLNAGTHDGKPIVDPVKLAWFRDVRFRRAVSHALDRDNIAANVYQSLATPLYGFVTKGNRTWSVDVPPTEYSLDKARALLQAAGFVTKGPADAPELYDAGGHRVAFTIIVQTENEPRAKSALVVQEDLRRLGMQVEVAPLSTTQLQNLVNNTYDYEATLYGTSVSEPDPSSYTDVLRSSSAQHFWYPKQTQPATEWEARLDELTTQQAHERDPERRHALFRDIQLLLAEQLPIIPIVTRHIAVAASLRIGNYRPSPLPPFSLWNADELFVRQPSQQQ